MKFSVDNQRCRGCGICERVCPQVFKMRNDMSVNVQVTPVPEELIDCALRAENICPLKIISHH